jgi:phosphatidate phosphatase PAH1
MYLTIQLNLSLFLLYGCEIWGSLNPPTARFRNETITLDKIYQNLKCELLHTKFCKFILGVHKKSTNVGLNIFD